jgi:hypothetical protein
MGHCPCPRCTITKDKISEVGMKRDKNNRQKLMREDNNEYQLNVTRAHAAIYEEGRGVKSAPVKRVLDKHSYVPIRVRKCSLHYKRVLIVVFFV